MEVPAVSGNRAVAPKVVLPSGGEKREFRGFPPIIVLVAALAMAGALHGQDAYVSWNPANPAPGYDTYEWTITVQQLPNPQSYIYWAISNSYQGGDTFSGGASCPKGSCPAGFYMGLQPYGTPALPCPNGASGCRIALFSFFGDGASSSSPNCVSSADGGPGESCRLIYDWQVGRPYKFVAALTGNADGLETWTATVTDTATDIKTTIASWSIPASNGLAYPGGISFTEYYGSGYASDCGAQPYAEVVWNTPIGYNNGEAYTHAVGNTWKSSSCPNNAAFAVTPASVTVQTGAGWPLIASVQDAESARTTVVPGEWAAIYGNYLSPSTRTWNAGDFTNGNNLPTSLDGVSVEFGGKPAAVYYVSPGQIDVQVPNALSGAVPVTVSVNGKQSASPTVAVVQTAPSLFYYTASSVSYAAATHADGSLIGDPSVTPNATPARPGETVVMYVNGLEPSPSGVLITAPVSDNNPVTVTIGGLNASLSYAGLVEAGLFQINAVVPAGAGNTNLVIFSDLNAADYGSGLCISGAGTSQCGPMTNRWLASPFTPSGSVLLTQIQLALGWISGANGAVIDLADDQSGAPGTTVLQSWNVPQLPPAGPTALVTLAPVDRVTLARGTKYWLVVKGAAGDTLDSWSGNSSGLTGTLLSLDQGASWNNGVLNLRAFDVLGTVVSGDIPAPVVVTAGGISSQPVVILPLAGN
jgi:uncharacterized protein (TIGR03437 family)